MIVKKGGKDIQLKDGAVFIFLCGYVCILIVFGGGGSCDCFLYWHIVS